MTSLKRRLLVLNGVVVLLSLVLATLASYLDSRQHLREQTLAQLNATATSEAQAIAAWVQLQRRVIESLQPAVAKAEPRPELAAAAQAGALDLAYIGHADKRMLQSRDAPLSEGYDPTQRPWYQQAEREAGVVITEPYIDDSTKQPVITFAMAVKAGGTTQAVVASDVYMTSVVEALKRIRPTPAGFAFLVGTDGRILAHARPELLLKPATDLVTGLTPQALGAAAAAGGRRRLAGGRCRHPAPAVARQRGGRQPLAAGGGGRCRRGTRPAALAAAEGGGHHGADAAGGPDGDGRGGATHDARPGQHPRGHGGGRRR